MEIFRNMSYKRGGNRDLFIQHPEPTSMGSSFFPSSSFLSRNTEQIISKRFQELSLSVERMDIDVTEVVSNERAKKRMLPPSPENQSPPKRHRQKASCCRTLVF